jgi:hypothetical protein
MMTGMTKHTKLGDGKALDIRLAELCPMLNDEDAESVKVSLNERIKAGYKTQFVRLNCSMVRRIAFMASEFYGRSFSRSMQGWFNHWGCAASLLDENSPSIRAIKPRDNVPEESKWETRDIKLLQISDHKNEKQYWDTKEFRSLFAENVGK